MASDSICASVGFPRITTSVDTGVNATKTEAFKGGDDICSHFFPCVKNSNGEWESAHPVNTNCNKKGTISNSKVFEGKETPKESAKKVDTAAENHCFGATDKSGSGHDASKETNFCTTHVVALGPGRHGFHYSCLGHDTSV